MDQSIRSIVDDWQWSSSSVQDVVNIGLSEVTTPVVPPVLVRVHDVVNIGLSEVTTTVVVPPVLVPVVLWGASVVLVTAVSVPSSHNQPIQIQRLISIGKIAENAIGKKYRPHMRLFHRAALTARAAVEKVHYNSSYRIAAECLQASSVRLISVES